MICAVILSLLGVADADVADEYALTDAGLASRREELMSFLVQSPALKGDRDAAQRMISARQVAFFLFPPPPFPLTRDSSSGGAGRRRPLLVLLWYTPSHIRQCPDRDSFPVWDMAAEASWR